MPATDSYYTQKQHIGFVHSYHIIFGRCVRYRRPSTVLERTVSSGIVGSGRRQRHGDGRGRRVRRLRRARRMRRVRARRLPRARPVHGVRRQRHAGQQLARQVGERGVLGGPHVLAHGGRLEYVRPVLRLNQSFTSGRSHLDD